MLIESNCMNSERYCKWYLGIKNETREEKNDRHVCEAFPDGIPSDIVRGKNLHEKKIKGQTGEYIYEEA